MDLIEIGKILREAREQKSLTIAEVEEQIKIGQSVIVALEEGNEDRFPHPVYARGFLRSYALLLDLDATELGQHFSREYPVPLDCDSADNHPFGVTMNVRGGKIAQGNFWVWILMALGIVLVGVLGWYLYTNYNKDSLTALENATTSTLDTDQNSVSESEVQSFKPMVEPKFLSDLPALNASVPFDLDTTEVNTNLELAAQEARNTTQEPGEDQNTTITEPGDAQLALDMDETPVELFPASTASEGQRTLLIKAHAATWLQARPDDSVTDYFLRKGESAQVHFSSALSVKFGNAGGVTLELDGQPYPFEAQSGEVRTLVVQ